MRANFGVSRNENQSTEASLLSENIYTQDEEEEETFSDEREWSIDQHSRAADLLSTRLLQVHTEEEEDAILRESFNLNNTSMTPTLTLHHSHAHLETSPSPSKHHYEAKARTSFLALIAIALVVLLGLGSLLILGIQFVGPPNQPVGPYRLLERQEGEGFFDFYNFYEGRDSAGSNGFNTYVTEQRANELGILNITMEQDKLDLLANSSTSRRFTTSTNSTTHDDDDMPYDSPSLERKPFIYMSSSFTTNTTPRESIRLEGKRRFNRGLFIIDLRHMPAGCGMWPAFWLTDEANWPVNGEIDIVEGVNYQSVAKTALHSTTGCRMDDVPLGVMTGTWDTSVGIPDKKTGIPDMTPRSATDCFVYNPKQWLNQGCVAVDTGVGSLGVPLNKKGGGVYVLEWDPINRHMRSWVFTPHAKVPDNLKESMATASQPNTDDRVSPDPDSWPLPYGYFPIGDETNCQASHFKNMRLVFNLAFCGSVSGNRYQLDCPKQSKMFTTCNEWIGSNPEEIKEAYWKVRGVYVYEREWQRAWL